MYNDKHLEDGVNNMLVEKRIFMGGVAVPHKKNTAKCETKNMGVPKKGSNTYASAHRRTLPDSC